VELKPLDDIGFAKPSPISGPVSEAVQAAARSLWAASRSPIRWHRRDRLRHLREIGIQSYGRRRSGYAGRSTRRPAAHGADERRPIKWIAEGVRFLREVTLQLRASPRAALRFHGTAP